MLYDKGDPLYLKDKTRKCRYKISPHVPPSIVFESECGCYQFAGRRNAKASSMDHFQDVESKESSEITFNPSTVTAQPRKEFHPPPHAFDATSQRMIRGRGVPRIAAAQRSEATPPQNAASRRTIRGIPLPRIAAARRSEATPPHDAAARRIIRGMPTLPHDARRIIRGQRFKP